jgi:hypothetical protein
MVRLRPASRGTLRAGLSCGKGLNTIFDFEAVVCMIFYARSSPAVSKGFPRLTSPVNALASIIIAIMPSTKSGM